uniref:mandelate racemase/muconate lactonizing enzyme family protein n=1 Tax=Scandinavium goeteborgense TaxID=1851514 RepID=UPI0013593BB7|nr:mandelate racemase/muconate lactonizing enzyme family protein [Scandinavium goeteborgense]
MAVITSVEVFMVMLEPKVRREDAIQAFVCQETPFVRITDSDGAQGLGYSYTIGTGGPAVLSLLEKTLAPALLGKEADAIEQRWRELLFLTHATSVGAITSLALATIDTALWDLRCKRSNQPLWIAAGGAQSRIPLYNTEGGWLNLSTSELVENALECQANGFAATKMKVGLSIKDDMSRLRAVREAVGDNFEIFTDANQAFRVDEAIRRAHHYEELDIGWLEEPLPADDLQGHIRLSQQTSVPIAVGESIYSALHFREYLQQNACSVVQVDVARIGGITPWLKVAHLAECFNIAVCPHFLMELHVSLCAAVPNARWLEYIPQLDTLTHQPMQVENGYGLPPSSPGLGIDWDLRALERHTLPGSYQRLTR